MDIVTKFGTAKDVSIELYNDASFILGKFNVKPFTPTPDRPRGEDSYDMLGFDVPIREDAVWRFWVEHNFSNGSSMTEDAGISDADKEIIKAMYNDYFFASIQPI